MELVDLSVRAVSGACACTTNVLGQRRTTNVNVLGQQRNPKPKEGVSRIRPVRGNRWRDPAAKQRRHTFQRAHDRAK
eukprot:scaffold8465_cov60-Phaeocystis_antarctica.AAC.7